MHCPAYHFTNKTVQEITDKQTQYKSEKVNNLKYSKQNFLGSVASYNTQPGNEVGLFYNAPEPTCSMTLNLKCKLGRVKVNQYTKLLGQR